MILIIRTDDDNPPYFCNFCPQDVHLRALHERNGVVDIFVVIVVAGDAIDPQWRGIFSKEGDFPNVFADIPIH